jgi:hypothetical protein
MVDEEEDLKLLGAGCEQQGLESSMIPVENDRGYENPWGIAQG